MPNTNALTTVARLKSFMGITSATHDTLLDSVVDATSQFIQNYCDRTFVETTYTNEIYDGVGTDKLMLRNYPVSTTAAFTLEVRTSPMNVSSWDAISSDLYHTHYNRGIIEMVGGRFYELPRHYRITYTAGYVFDNAATFLEDVNAGDLEYAVWKLATDLFRQRKQGTGVQSESIGEYSVTLRKSTMVNQEIRDILANYKRPHLY
jgi:hypothetical protein